MLNERQIALYNRVKTHVAGYVVSESDIEALLEIIEPMTRVGVTVSMKKIIIHEVHKFKDAEWQVLLTHCAELDIKYGDQATTIKHLIKLKGMNYCRQLIENANA